MFRKQFFILCILLLFSGQAMGQVTTATISGVVRDESGAVLPGATVRVRNLETGITRTAVTDEQGRYHAPNLSLGNYEVEASLAGFQTEVRSGIKLTVGREAIVDFTLKVGEITEKVVVTGEAPLVEITKSSVSNLVDERMIKDLPLNQRSFEQLAMLQPFVVHSRAAVPDPRRGVTAKMSITGARPNQNVMLLDGTDINPDHQYNPGSVGGNLLGVDTIREFKVEAATYSAEFGHAAGGVVNVTTKSGTNELHGTAFIFHRNSALDARNFFDRGTEPPEFKRNQLGFSVGGPIKRDKAFFLGSYETFIQRLGLTTIARVPNSEVRTTEGARRAGILRPDETINPKVKPYLDLFPLPNGRDFGNGTAEFLGVFSEPTDEHFFTTRIDHQFSDKDSFFARYTFHDGTKEVIDLIRNPFPFMPKARRSRNQYVTLQEQKIISPNLLNTFRFGLNRSLSSEKQLLLFSIPPGLDWTPLAPLYTSGSLRVSGISQFGPDGRLPRLSAWNLFEWSDDMTYARGIHSLKWGLLIKRIQNNSRSHGTESGEYSFRSLRDFLLGRAFRFRSDAPGRIIGTGWRTTAFGFYIQDDVRLKPNLTLNLGLRYEPMTNPIEVGGRFSKMFDLFGPEIIGNPLWRENLTTNNWAPRFGFAWDPSGGGKMAIRGGFGIFYDRLYNGDFAFGGSGSFGGGSLDLRNPPFPDAFKVASQSPPLATGGGGDFYTDNPARYQWSLTIQREIAANTVFSAGYAGSRGVHLFRRSDFNIAFPVILPDGRQFFPPGVQRRNPRLQDFRPSMTDANAFYHGVQLMVNRRLSRGLQFQASYTLGKSIDEAGGVIGREFFSSEFHTYDPYNPKIDRSLSDWDVRHNFIINYVYDLPFGPGRRFGGNLSGAVGKMAEGWQISGITTIASGSPLTANLDQLNQSNNQFTGSTARSERPNLVHGRSNNPKLGSPDNWYDGFAFELQPLGFYGNLGRNTIIGPGVVMFDFSVSKNIYLAEKKYLQFRAEFFNLFNRANFGTPDRFVFDGRGRRIPDPGRIRFTSTSSRQIQFGLKFYF